MGELAGAIESDFPGGDGHPPLWLVGALRGAVYFLADLSRALSRDVGIAFLRASSYGDGVASSGEVRIESQVGEEIRGHDVIVVEDIVDSGRTAAAVRSHLLSFGPRSLRLASLLSKPDRREVEVAIDYLGFEIPDRFVVGYGLDYAERYRNRSEIGYLEFESDSKPDPASI